MFTCHFESWKRHVKNGFCIPVKIYRSPQKKKKIQNYQLEPTILLVHRVRTPMHVDQRDIVTPRTYRLFYYHRPVNSYETQNTQISLGFCFRLISLLKSKQSIFYEKWLTQTISLSRDNFDRISIIRLFSMRFPVEL